MAEYRSLNDLFVPFDYDEDGNRGRRWNTATPADVAAGKQLYSRSMTPETYDSEGRTTGGGASYEKYTGAAPGTQQIRTDITPEGNSVPVYEGDANTTTGMKRAWDEIPGDTPEAKVDAWMKGGRGTTGVTPIVAAQNGWIPWSAVTGNWDFMNMLEDSQRRAQQRNGWEQAFDVGFNIFAGIMLGGAIGAGFGALTGGAGATGSAVADAGAFGGMDAAAVGGADYTGMATAAGGASDSIANAYLSYGGTPSTGQELLLADAGTTMTDVGPGLVEQGGALSETGAFDMGQFAPQDVGLTPASQSQPGLIDSWMKFSKENPVATVVGAQLAGGVIQGIGAAQRQDEALASQERMQERNISAQRELLDQRLEDAKAMEEFKRRFTQAGSYFDATPKVKPAADKVLRRPDGTPVYSGGVISTGMR